MKEADKLLKIYDSALGRSKSNNYKGLEHEGRFDGYDQ